jgi:hypothetical protein
MGSITLKVAARWKAAHSETFDKANAPVDVGLARVVEAMGLIPGLVSQASGFLVTLGNPLCAAGGSQVGAPRLHGVEQDRR